MLVLPIGLILLFSNDDPDRERLEVGAEAILLMGDEDLEAIYYLCQRDRAVSSPVLDSLLGFDNDDKIIAGALVVDFGGWSVSAHVQKFVGLKGGVFIEVAGVEDWCSYCCLRRSVQLIRWSEVHWNLGTS